MKTFFEKMKASCSSCHYEWKSFVMGILAGVVLLFVLVTIQHAFFPPSRDFPMNRGEFQQDQGSQGGQGNWGGRQGQNGSDRTSREMMRAIR